MSGPPSLRWARLNYPDSKKLWHATDGHWSICGHEEFDHPRAEYVESKPERGKLCQLCVAKLCGECGGTGEIVNDGPYSVCDDCNGTGRVA